MRAEIRILVLDDNENDYLIIQRSLKRQAVIYQSRRVYSRKEFCSELELFSPHVVFAEQSVFGYSALEAVRYCRNQDISVAFILVTGMNPMEIAPVFVNEHTDGYVLKGNYTQLSDVLYKALLKRGIRIEI